MSERERRYPRIELPARKRVGFRLALSITSTTTKTNPVIESGSVGTPHITVSETAGNSPMTGAELTAFRSVFKLIFYIGLNGDSRILFQPG